MKLEILIITLIGLFSINQAGVIPEEDFKQLKSFDTVKLELNNELKEAYFYFDNNFDHQDVVINLKVGKDYSVHCYFYSSISDIVKEGEEYKNFFHELTFNTKEVYLPKNHEKNVKGRFYLVIKDVLNKFNTDYMTMYNEKDTNYLQSNVPFEINQFYSSKVFLFSYESSGQERITINIINNNKENLDEIVITLNGEEIQKTTSDLINYTYLKDNVTPSGTYMVTITTSKDPYIANKKNVLLYKQDKQLIKIIPNEMKTISYIGSQSGLFYAALDGGYEKKEINTLNLKFAPGVKAKAVIKQILGKVVEAASEEESILLPLIPTKEEESTIKHQLMIDSDNIYEVYYKVPETITQTNKFYLLISLEISIDEFIEPNEFSLGLSFPIEIIDFTKYTQIGISSKSYPVKADIPYYVQAKVPIDNSRSFAFYISNGDYLTVYNGTLFQNNEVNTKYQKTQLFALSKNDKTFLTTYTFKVFSDSDQVIEAMVQIIASDLIFFQESRPVKIIQREITNCMEPFYILGSYEVNTKSNFIYLETINGQFELLVKKDIKNSILPTEEDAVNDPYALLQNKIDLVGVRCINPGRINLIIVDNSFPSTFQGYDTLVGYVNKNTKTELTLPVTKETNLQMISYLGKEITIKVKDQIITLTDSKKVSNLILEGREAECTMILEAGNEGVFLGIKWGGSKLYKTLEESATRLKEPNIIIPIKKNSDYKQVTISSKYLLSKHSIMLTRTIEQKYEFTPLLSRSNIDQIDGDFSITIVNPYDMYPQNSIYTTEDMFYLAVELYSLNETIPETDITIEYQAKEHIEPTPDNSSILITKENTRIELKHSENPTAPLSIIAHSCAEGDKAFGLYYYNNEINSFKFSRKYDYYQTKNFMIDLQLEVKSGVTEDNYNGISLVYLYDDIDKSEIDGYNTKTYKITSGDNSETVEWEKFDKSDVSYQVYFFPKGYSEEKYIENDCYLSTLKKNESNDEAKFYYYENTEPKLSFNETGDFEVVVVANSKGKFPIRVVYGKKEISLSSGGVNSLTWFYITAPCVIAFIIVLIVVILRLKAKKKLEINEQENERLVPNSITTEEA